MDPLLSSVLVFAVLLYVGISKARSLEARAALSQADDDSRRRAAHWTAILTADLARREEEKKAMAGLTADPKEAQIDAIIEAYGGARAACLTIADNYARLDLRYQDLSKDNSRLSERIARLQASVAYSEQAQDDVFEFLVNANASRKNFQRSYKKARRREETLRGQHQTLRCQYERLLDAVINRETIEVRLPDRFVIYR
jgi:DNA repair exonuclease SbcCD ATPase subunit